jgi:hypothetical protein
MLCKSAALRGVGFFCLGGFEDCMSGAFLRFGGLACAVLLVAGCAVKKEKPLGKISGPATPVVQGITCSPAEANSAMIGTWYATSTPRGVSGQLQTLTTLAPDGTMKYETQLKIGKKVRPALRESGCWTYRDNLYTMQTVRSNGELVDADDPIYRNTYRVEKVNAGEMKLRDTHSGSQTVSGRKVGPSFRLP